MSEVPEELVRDAAILAVDGLDERLHWIAHRTVLLTMKLAYSRGVADGRKAGRKEAAAKIRQWLVDANFPGPNFGIIRNLVEDLSDIAEGEDDE